MMTLISVVHVIVALMLILLVMIQDSKGGAMGGMFGGGGSGSVFGATGATTFFAKLTRIVAVMFALTCIGLTVYSSKETKSVLDGVAVPVKQQTAPAAPTTPTDTAPATK